MRHPLKRQRECVTLDRKISRTAWSSERASEYTTIVEKSAVQEDELSHLYVVVLNFLERFEISTTLNNPLASRKLRPSK